MRQTTKNEQEMHTSVVRFINMLHRSLKRVDKAREKKENNGSYLYVHTHLVASEALAILELSPQSRL